VPGVDVAKIQELVSQPGTLFGFLDIFAGGALSRFSVFAMSITPYINASIIMNLLTMVVPQFEEWAKEGREGRRKLSKYTRYGTVVLGLIQAIGTTFFMRNLGALESTDPVSIGMTAITLTAGTAFLMWLGEQITEHGIGNGISLLIFAGIVSRLPAGTANTIRLLMAGTISIFNLILLSILGLIVIALIIWVQEGQRRVPVRYAKRVVGRKMYGGQSTHIPMKINPAGVIPVIFASSVLAFPPTLAQFIDHPIAESIAQALDFGTPLYTTVYALLIIFFTYFYTAVQFNPVDVANNIKKNGGFVPGLRPGRPTAEYLDRVLVRITLAGAIFLAAVAVMPTFFGQLVDIPNLYFGGTALLIVIGVALETMKQIEAHLMMRHYEGFMQT
jgi:preprotein translocase subunit SecY